MGHHSNSLALLSLFNTGLFSILLFSIQTSAGVPPQAETIIPTGIFNFCCNSRAKKYPVALVARMVSGEQTVHVALQFCCGNSAPIFCTWKIRIFGLDAFAASSSPLISFQFTLISIFDWPLQIQTSPNITLLSVTLLLPRI